MNKLKEFYGGKTVLVTGHTGFKGSWLSIWLLELGAHVIGYSLDIPNNPYSNFEACRLEGRVKHLGGKVKHKFKDDVKDIVRLRNVFNKYKPEVVFHLAAQPIVRRSYNEPRETFLTNIAGTVNVLECLREFNFVKSAVIITSDKCYKNQELRRGYKENDQMGGDDPYSASKGAAELVFHSYCESFFKHNSDICKIASARAGNVIGGGDWAADRIIPDFVRACDKKKPLSIRNPMATRPWQHVLESLSGYLWLASQLPDNRAINCNPFNFGPNKEEVESVKQLIVKFRKYFGSGENKFRKDVREIKETKFLNLSCKKARDKLKWHSVLSFDKTVKMTADWYRLFYNNKNVDMFAFSQKQIKEYVSCAQKEGLEWAKENSA